MHFDLKPILQQLLEHVPKLPASAFGQLGVDIEALGRHPVRAGHLEVFHLVRDSDVVLQ